MIVPVLVCLNTSACVMDTFRSYTGPYNIQEVEVSRNNAFDRKAWVKNDDVSINATLDAGSLAPLSDVTCVIPGPGYMAEFSLPARVAIPNFGYRSPNLTGTCTRGNVTRTFLIRADNITRPNHFKEQGGITDGLISILFDRAAPVVRAMMHDETKDTFKYTDRVNLEFPAGPDNG